MSTPRVILGIWGYSSDQPQVQYHDSGAAVVKDGRVMSAINEERITRKKNEGSWPERSIAEALRLAGITLADVEHVALAGLPPIARATAMWRELWSNYRRTGIFLGNRWLYALLAAKKLRRHGPGCAAPVSCVAHHDAHAASAYYTAPFEDAAIVTLDGIGDSAHCGGVYAGRGDRMERLRLFSGYASVGLLYSYVTKAFGFRPARHEGKITGLAAHGDSDKLIDRFRERLEYRTTERQLFSRFIPHLFRSRVDALWETSWIDELQDEFSREDIAAALQRHTEELAVAIVRDALTDTGLRNVALAGGVFANVRVNQRIRKIVPGQVWIHPNMGDGGLGLGAALAVAGTRAPLADVYLGSGIEDLEKIAASEVPHQRVPHVARVVARACAEKLIVGHAAGRMEYGPRALGHRTIFASAADATINNTLNDRLHRTEFMPFAPIMTEKAAAALLKNWSPADAAARFMTITYDVTGECKRIAPAIVHVDGTARPQVVSPASGIIHEILVEYGKLTGSEILINTSFNIHEEPIVRTAADAFRSYSQDAVDVLAVEDTVFAEPALLKRILA